MDFITGNSSQSQKALDGRLSAANNAPATILVVLLVLELTNTALALNWGNTICVRINGDWRDGRLPKL